MSDEIMGLSLTQPWASLVALGHKQIETRSWHTGYRGLVAIHAAKGWPQWAKTVCYDEPFRSRLVPPYHWTANGPNLPTGAVVAVAELTACIETDTTGLWAKAMPRPGTPERAFGDYAPGRYAWFLADMRRLPEPVICSGALGLWRVQDELRACIEAALAGQGVAV